LFATSHTNEPVIFKYSEHLKNGPPSLWMVIFWIQFVSGFWMVWKERLQPKMVFRPQYIGKQFI
jgi:hypothetical protein